MSYYHAKQTSGSFDQVAERVTEELKKEGFGVLTRIDVRQTMKEKLGVDMANYLILGACNPQFAHQALQQEQKIGTMLPCNVVVLEHDGGQVEVAAVDPMTSMRAIDTPALGELAQQVQAKLKAVVDRL